MNHDEQIEAGARALHRWVGNAHPWEEATDDAQTTFREGAAAVLDAITPEGCPKCGYSGGCMESWEAGDGTMIDCGTCPACIKREVPGE